MKNRISAAFAGLGVLLAASAHAQDAPRLTLADAAKRALAQYPSIAAAQAREDVARRELGEANAQWFPTLNVAASATRYEDPMVVTPIHGFGPGILPEFDDTLLQSALTADWLLFDGGGRGARIGQRRSLLDAASADETASEQMLLGRTVSGYLRVVGYASTLAAHDRRLEALESEQHRVQQLKEVGRAADVELRRVDAERAAANAERVRLASALDVAERDLARWMGVDVAETRASRLTSVALADTSLPAREALLEAALAASPTVRAAARRADAAGRAITAARSARWPNLHVVGNYLSYGNSDADFKNEWNAGLKLQLPLFTGGAISSRIGQSQASRSAADADLRLARLRLTEDLDRALASREEARSRVQSLTTAAAEFGEVARIEKLRLDSEAGTQTDFLEAEAQLLGAEAQLVDARHAEIVARVEIARITGTLDLAWIERTLEAES
jgi:outer membrane protein